MYRPAASSVNSNRPWLSVVDMRPSASPGARIDTVASPSGRPDDEANTVPEIAVVPVRGRGALEWSGQSRTGRDAELPEPDCRPSVLASARRIIAAKTARGRQQVCIAGFLDAKDAE